MDVVVVLSFRGARDTIACVESLVTGSPEAVVLVIDNGSFDGVLELVEQRWPGVHTLQTGDNLGFAGGMNRGLRWALDHGADSVTLLNNDTIVPAGAIASLSAVAATGCLVSPEVRYADDPHAVWFGGGVIEPATGLARHLTSAELARRDARPDGGLRASQVLAGCCLTASTATWRRVGGFDEAYFLNFEDSDLSLRAAGLGVPLVVATAVVVRHRVSASFTAEYSYLGLFYYARNGLLFGARLPGRSLPRRVRFVRRRVVPVVLASAREGDWAGAGRRALIVIVALAMHVRGRYGRAPRWLERAARGWAG